jgi:molecular chaperone DnaK
LARLKKAIEDNDLDAMRTATDEVANASQTLGAAMYTMAQEAGGSEATADAAGDTSEDDVIDAEIVEEDDNK